MRYIISIIIAILIGWGVIFNAEETGDPGYKVNGVSLVSPSREVTSSHMDELERVNADWVAIIPYAFAQSGEPSITFDHDRQWRGERTEGTIELIQLAKEQGLKIMLKPHVWVRGEHWTGDFTLSDENKWKIWEKDFSNYILHFARLADSLNVELLCIGTEYRIPAKERPDFWRKLIGEVRNNYSGKITYASNWDNYMNITWWDAVDYIGIDAYFPLVEEGVPSLEEIKDGWDPIKQDLKAFSNRWNKQILFTEYGFQSADGAAGNHWEIDRSNALNNDQLQADAYEATFQSLMDQSWYAGGFFWKWYFHQRNPERYQTDWTPQGKLAEKVIAKWYGINNKKTTNQQ
ncbi:MAG: hypothetical protein ACFHWX_01615 [Bacteroidota bacterium]